MNKKISILFLSIFAIAFLSFQIIEEDRDKSLIYWDDRAVDWNDFKGKTPKASPYVALTHSAIKLIYGGENTTLRFIIETVFYPKTSWKKKKVVNEHILKHEQGHFDLTEYYSRLLRRDVAKLKFKNVNSIDQQMNKLFNKHSKEAGKIQDQYDKETNHSVDEDEQRRWEEKIKSLLDETAKYTETIIDMDIAYLLE